MIWVNSSLVQMVEGIVEDKFYICGLKMTYKLIALSRSVVVFNKVDDEDLTAPAQLPVLSIKRSN